MSPLAGLNTTIGIRHQGLAALATRLSPYGATQKSRRPAFTLFELILAIALSAALLAIIGTAINLYLTQVDSSRTRVEQSQLARSVLAMIADDIRATTIYKPQDTSAIARLMASSTSFDVDSVDEERPSSTGSPGTSTSVGGAMSSFGGGGSGSSQGSSSMSGGDTETEESMPLGLNGSMSELYIDATRLPRRDELFSTLTGYTNAPMPVPSGGAAAGAAPPGLPPTDLKTIRYFIRPGEQVAAGSVAATSLSPELEARAGGLVRQETPRRMRVWAEQLGDSAILESGQKLIAPEVVHLEFRYYDGEQIVDVWDMREAEALPRAIEVRIWLATSNANQTAGSSTYSGTSLSEFAREYRQTVFLPMSDLTAGEGAAGDSSSDSSTDSSSESESSSAGGFGFGEP